MPWVSKIRTSQNEVILRELWKGDKSVRNIARDMNTSSDSVYSWLYDLGLKEKRKRSGGTSGTIRRGGRATEIVQRMCLNCLKIFPSTWIGNRRCDTCKDLIEYKGSPTVFEQG